MAKVPEDVARKIQEAKANRSESLDLSYPDAVQEPLTDFPADLLDLPDLKTLGLRGNALTSLPESLGSLTGLTSLDLSHNRLTSLPDVVTRLTGLTALDLSGSQSGNNLTSLPEALGNLTGLTALDLGGNALTSLPEAIGNLTGLTALSLNNNALTSLPEALGSLTGLTSLDLSFHGLASLPEVVTRLTGLTTLNLYGNCLTSLPEALASLTGLTELDLGSNALASLPEALASLTGLTNLRLSGNGLTSLPEVVTRLTGLTTLNLYGNTLASLPEGFASLTGLTNLRLGGNGLTFLPDVVTRLTGLTTLNLDGNDLTSLPEALANLTGLTELGLSNNGLTSLPEMVTRLTRLTKLDLSNNDLASLSEALGNLTGLTTLKVDGNDLNSLPEGFGNLTSLTKLYLSRNCFDAIPEVLYALPNLEILTFGTTSVSRSNIREISPQVLRMQKLTTLDLEGNPVEKPPLEVVAQGVEAIKGYFRQLQAGGEDRLYEAKLLILGEAGAGKTTLAEKIRDPDYQLKDEKSTEGVQKTTWSFPMENGRDFRVNIWDFGGQEIYHATHQFFLTQRSLYVLVSDDRKEDTDFYYWLSIVELLGDDSPLLILKNEKQDRQRDINERQLRGEFTNLERVLTTNLSTNRGLTGFLDQVKHQICRMPHIGSPLPKTWVDVRNALEHDPRNHIALAEYFELCQRNGFTAPKDKLQLSAYLHDLGVCLHFQKDPLLNKTVILKPNWGTAAVYKVLDNKKVIANRGRFDRTDLAAIWHEPEYADMHDELLGLMINFKLCYQLQGRDAYISPQLLSENQPSYEWDDVDNLILRYTYEFLPKGIVSRLIVAMHTDIAQQDLVWKSGVIFQQQDTRAEVIEYYGKREIQIRVAGKRKKDLLTIIVYEVDKIHKSYPRLKFSKLIPCHCEKCRGTQDPYFYDFETLQRYLGDRRRDIECQKSYQRIDVRGLIDDVVNSSETQDERGISDKEKRPSMNNSVTVIVQAPAKGDTYMSEEHYAGNKYGISGGQQVVVGDNGNAEHFTQIQGSQQPLDLKALAEELGRVYEAAKDRATEPEDQMKIGAIAAAKGAAEKGDESKVLTYLKSAGKWALGIATDIGTKEVEELLKTQLLSG